MHPPDHDFRRRLLQMTIDELDDFYHFAINHPRITQAQRHQLQEHWQARTTPAAPPTTLRQTLDACTWPRLMEIRAQLYAQHPDRRDWLDAYYDIRNPDRRARDIPWKTDDTRA